MKHSGAGRPVPRIRVAKAWRLEDRARAPGAQQTRFWAGNPIKLIVPLSIKILQVSMTVLLKDVSSIFFYSRVL